MAILNRLMETGKPLQIDELRRAPWHEALYAKLGGKTRQRDLSGLREQGLRIVEQKGLVRPGYMK